MAVDPSSPFYGWEHDKFRNKAMVQVTVKGGDAAPNSSSDAPGVGWAYAVALVDPTAVDSGVLGTSTNPIHTTGGGGSLSLTAATHVQTAAVASNLVAKNAAGTLYGIDATADATLDAADWWLMVFDATSAPADGAVAPAKVWRVPAGQTNAGMIFNTAGVAFLVGITIVASTTGPFNKTASAHAFIGADIV